MTTGEHTLRGGRIKIYGKENHVENVGFLQGLLVKAISVIIAATSLGQKSLSEIQSSCNHQLRFLNPKDGSILRSIRTNERLLQMDIRLQILSIANFGVKIKRIRNRR